jgi:predicted nucleotidyltransferase
MPGFVWRGAVQMSAAEQIDFLVRNVPGVTTEQAAAILEQGFSRGSSVVFGGSRVRGNANVGSDVDVGFGSLTARQAQRVIKDINSLGFEVPLEKLTIVPGKSTSSIQTIISPEEFFQRSGIRAGGDLRAGEPYIPSGSITLTKDGRIVITPPGKF